MLSATQSVYNILFLNESFIRDNTPFDTTHLCLVAAG